MLSFDSVKTAFAFDRYTQNWSYNLAEFRIDFWPPPTPQGPIAFLTMARDETFLMKAWIENGLRISPAAEFFVLDHGSAPALASTLSEFTDGRGVKINFMRIPPVPFDDDFKAMALTSFAKVLLQGYEIVVTTDCDELLVGLGLRDNEVLPTLQSLEGIAAPIGFEVVQHISRENAFDPSAPIELQRAYGFFASGYTKPVIWKKRSEFSAGLHAVRDDFEYAPTLGLLHLRSVDASISDSRAAQRREFELSPSQLQAGRGGHWHSPLEKKINFFAKLNSLDTIPECQDLFPDFMGLLTGTHKKSGSGFYGHDISHQSGYCHIGDILYV